jgi:hypothetical protein
LAADEDTDIRSVGLSWGRGRGRARRRVSESMNGLSYLALGIGLLTETSFAFGQVAGEMTIAQVTGSAPSSGVLMTQSPAPVTVPSSGVLAAVERQITFPLKATQEFQITNGPAGTTRRRVVHRRIAVRRENTTSTAAAQQSVATSSMVGTAADPRHASTGYEPFLSTLGKGKLTGE